jgi:hypothetical protein
MDYERWRNDVFGQPPDEDVMDVVLLQETYDVPLDEAFDHIDQALVDSQIHNLFAKSQIGNGLQLIYSASCTDLPFCYVKAGDEDRRIAGIRNLENLYSNYFERYCGSPVRSVGNDLRDGTIGYLCYMFWDIFVLSPGDASPAMIDAGIGVMESALRSQNEQCLASAIHGLGHWRSGNSHARRVLRQWLRKPTTRNKRLLEYARQAATGCIL